MYMHMWEGKPSLEKWDRGNFDIWCKYTWISLTVRSPYPSSSLLIFAFFHGV